MKSSVPIHYSGEVFGEDCLTELARLECHRLPELEFSICTRIYRGHAVEGAVCLAPNWCGKDLGCAFEPGKDYGFCRPLGREGEPCGSCEWGLTCDASSKTCRRIYPSQRDWCGYGETCQRGVCIDKWCRTDLVCTGMPRDAGGAEDRADGGVDAGPADAAAGWDGPFSSVDAAPQ